MSTQLSPQEPAEADLTNAELLMKLRSAGLSMVAAASDEGTALQLEEKFAEMQAMLAALKAAASRKRKSLQEARLRARFQEQGLWNAWTRGGASILMWALQTLPECLLARSGMFPSHRVVKWRRLRRECGSFWGTCSGACLWRCG